MSKNYLELFKKDYEFGKQSEDEVLKILQNFFNDSSIIQNDRLNVFDFSGDNKQIELKTRNCTYDKYPTTMIGYNKIIVASNSSIDSYFFFKFTDGLYYWKYDKNIKCEIRKAGRTNRGRNEYSDYFFIPINILQKV